MGDKIIDEVQAYIERQPVLTESEMDLIRVCREVRYGKLTIVLHNGPVEVMGEYKKLLGRT